MEPLQLYPCGARDKIWIMQTWLIAIIKMRHLMIFRN